MIGKVAQIFDEHKHSCRSVVMSQKKKRILTIIIMARLYTNGHFVVRFSRPQKKLICRHPLFLKHLGPRVKTDRTHFANQVY